VPLPWTGGVPPYGFSDAAPEACWFPQPADWAQRTVAAQENDEHSMLTLYRTALHLRRAHPATDTAVRVQGPAHGEWFAFDRSPRLRCLVNFGPQPVRLADGARVLLSSAPLDGRDVPQDTAVWTTFEESLQ
jgi:alpha-glucosidase